MEMAPWKFKGLQESHRSRRRQALGRLKRLKQKWKAAIIPNPCKYHVIISKWLDFARQNLWYSLVHQNMYTAPQRQALLSKRPQPLARFSTRRVIDLIYRIYLIYLIYRIYLIYLIDLIDPVVYPINLINLMDLADLIDLVNLIDLNI